MALNVELEAARQTTTEGRPVAFATGGAMPLVQLVTPPEHGQLLVLATGDLAHLPDPDFVGTDRLRYRTVDAAATVEVEVAAESSKVEGTRGDDVLNVDPGIRLVDGGLGNDNIQGSRKGEVLFGGGGADLLDGLDGDDILRGGNGRDVLRGRGGADVFVIESDAGPADVVSDFSRADGDRLLLALPELLMADGRVDASRLRTEGARDLVVSADLKGDGDYTEIAVLEGGARLALTDVVANDFDTSGGLPLELNPDAEILTGTAGDDVLTAGGMDAVLRGRGGDDLLQGRLGIDYFEGGSGNDTVDFSYSGVGWVFTLEDGRAGTATSIWQGGPYVTEYMVGVENITGARGDDVFTGNGARNVFTGGPGADTVRVSSVDRGTVDRFADFDLATDVIEIGDVLAVPTSEITADNFARHVRVLRLDGRSELQIDVDGAGDWVSVLALPGTLVLPDFTYGENLRFVGASAASRPEPAPEPEPVPEPEPALEPAAARTADQQTTSPLESDPDVRTLTGTAAGESLRGNGADEVILGRGGDDVLDGRGGTSVLRGGGGDDVLVSGSVYYDRFDYADWDLIDVRFDTFRQLFDGGKGSDTLDLGDSKNTRHDIDLRDGVLVEGSNRTFTPDGHKTLLTSIENVVGSGGRDIVRGSDADNVLDGGGYLDRLHGGAGDDTIYGGPARDRLYGGTGDNLLDGGGGLDRVSYFDFDLDGIVVDLARGRTVRPDGTDTLVGIEWADGGQGDDRLIGDATANELFGDGGDDVLRGGRGNDDLTGGSGADRFVFESGRDGKDTVTDWGFGDDVVDLSALGVTSVADLAIENGRDVVITVAGAADFELTLTGASASNLDFTDIERGLVRAGPSQVHLIPQVPSYEWVYSCEIVAMSSIAAYWDHNGYDNMMGAQGWDELRLTENVTFDLISREYVEKYRTIPDDTSLPEPSTPSMADHVRTMADGAPFPTRPVGGDDFRPLRWMVPDYAADKGYAFVSEFDKGYRDWAEPGVRDELWATLKWWMDAGHPAAIRIEDHMQVMFGYAESADGSRWYAVYDDRSPASLITGEFEHVVWEPFGSWWVGNPDLGIRTAFYTAPEGLERDGGRGDDTVKGGGGNDVLAGRGGDDVLRGGLGHDVLRGDGGRDRLLAAMGNDELDGGAGADRLVGGIGSDRLTGGPGADRFVFTAEAGPGVDVVTDFTAADGDRIDLTAFAFPGFGAVRGLTSRSGDDVVLALDEVGGERVLVQDVRPAELDDASLFLL
jgi:Ca2+-binding RTX toxin-like protein